MWSEEENSMRVKLIIAVSVLMLLLSATAYTQSFTADISYAFTAGGKVLPPGTDTFAKSSNTTVLIKNADGAEVSRLVTTWVSGPTAITESGIVFDVSGNTRVVSEVWLPGAGGFLVQQVAAGHTIQRLIGIPTGSAKLDGKRAFAQTCAMCHGAQGEGSPDADKFFKITIPRLDSEAVQAKSDQEIKDIITGGRRKMEPVRIEDQGTRHLLQTQSVDEIIAYLRTLKK
jgi:cytochrome c553